MRSHQLPAAVFASFDLHTVEAWRVAELRHFGRIECRDCSVSIEASSA
jgi:hypothetical protein